MLCARLSAQSELTGKSEAELLELRGKPISKTVVGTKAIYRWPDMEVGLTNGKVTSAYPRNLSKESEIRAQSQKASQEAAKRKAAADAKQKKDRAINEQYLADAANERAKAAEAERQLQFKKMQQEMQKKDKEQQQLADSNRVQIITQAMAEAERRQKNPDVYDKSGRLIKK